MCLAMCIGGIPLNAAFFGLLALFGVTYSEDQLPTWAFIAIGVILATVMAAWMRFRGHEWRPTLEMRARRSSWLSASSARRGLG
jgi:hypothetical protein